MSVGAEGGRGYDHADMSSGLASAPLLPVLMPCQYNRMNALVCCVVTDVRLLVHYMVCVCIQLDPNIQKDWDNREFIEAISKVGPLSDIFSSSPTHPHTHSNLQPCASRYLFLLSSHLTVLVWADDGVTDTLALNPYVCACACVRVCMCVWYVARGGGVNGTAPLSIVRALPKSQAFSTSLVRYLAHTRTEFVRGRLRCGWKGRDRSVLCVLDGTCAAYSTSCLTSGVRVFCRLVNPVQVGETEREGVITRAFSGSH